VDEVVARVITHMGALDEPLQPTAEEDLVGVVRISTAAVARWMAGAPAEAAREVGWEAWAIFGRLTVERTIPLDRFMKSCLRWRDVSIEVIEQEAARHDVDPVVADRARAMLRRSLDVTFVRIAEQFELGRRRTDEQLELHQAELMHHADHDYLTGLPNRRAFDTHLGAVLAGDRARRGAVLFLDLDGFKEVNDTIGHSSGDRLLVEVGARLRRGVRDPDVVFRFGGDEFAIVITSDVDPKTAEEIALRLRKTLWPPFTVDGKTVQIEASVGVAFFPEHGRSADLLVQYADSAMYAAKRAGLHLVANEQ
jgi:diguanylate cyclase (GGDEF)-like protein